MWGSQHEQQPVRRFKTPTATAKPRPLHHSLARKKRGGKNRHKTLLQVQHQQEHGANQRQDGLHHIATNTERDILACFAQYLGELVEIGGNKPPNVDYFQVPIPCVQNTERMFS